MPKVVRVGDSLSTGHGCTGTTTIASSNQGVDNVYANGILVDVVGAPTVGHPFPPDPPCQSARPTHPIAPSLPRKQPLFLIKI